MQLGRSFYRLWAGQAVSSFGSQVSILALPLIAVHTLNASAFAVSVLSAATFLPYLLFGLHAGAYVDRLDKRRLMLVCDAARGLLLLLIPLGMFAGVLSVGLLCAVAFLSSTAGVVFDIAYGSYLPDVVTNPLHLPVANARLETTRSASQTFGPGIAGWLVHGLGGPLAIIADAGSYLVSVLSLASLPKTAAQGAQRIAQAPGLKEIGAGFSFIRHHPLLRPLLWTYSLCTLFTGAHQAVVIVYMTRVLGCGADTVGLVFSIGNSGFLCGAAISGLLTKRLGLGATLIFALGTQALGMLLQGTLPAMFCGGGQSFLGTATLILGQFCITIGVPLYTINMVSLRQVVTPKALLGRVGAVSRVLGRGLVPLGALLGGCLASMGNPRLALCLAGAGALCSLLPAMRSRVLRRLRNLSEISVASI